MRYISISSILLLGLLVHLDWRLGRGHDHRFSGEWSYHWITGFLGCLLVVFLLTRKSPRWLTPAAALNVALGLVLGQFLEPLGEALVSHLPVAQIVTVERSQIFREFMVAGIAGLVAGILLFGKQKSENVPYGVNRDSGHRSLPYYFSPSPRTNILSASYTGFSMEIIFGVHAVEEALAARGRRFDYVALAPGRGDARIQKIAQLCRSAGVTVRSMPRDQLTRLAKTASHQGVVAITAEKQYGDLEDLLARRRGQYAFLVVLDGIEDPHNLGAIVRTAEGAGVDGVVIPERRAAGVTGTVVKASAGASEYLPMAKVTNISRTVEELKSHNIWTVGLDERGSQLYDQIDYKMDCALILGAEGHGLHEQIRKKCDFLVSIPMLGKVPSLNVSVAGAIVMYEVARQRRKEPPIRKQP